MQTFITSPNFKATAKMLDDKRLGKQRVEALQIENTLEILNRGYDPITDGARGWVSHPAVLMWRGFERMLGAYKNAMICEWIERGFKNTMEFSPYNKLYVMPRWYTNGELLHRVIDSHRANLVQKDPAFYSPKFTEQEVGNKKPYYWPRPAIVL